MSDKSCVRLSLFQRYLTLWVILCIMAGILMGRLFPEVATTLDRLSFHQVSIPIALCLFFMMYPIMVKIDFTQIDRAFRTPKPVLLTLIINWGIKPFTMLWIAQFFFGLSLSTLVKWDRGHSWSRDSPSRFLYCRHHFAGHCPLYSDGADVGVPSLWQSGTDVGDGGD